MLLKDTIRLIKKTLKRFFTIVAIVFIGVAFMMGLASTSTVMRKSIDIYNKDTNLQDYQILSNFGFCDDDINAIKNLEYVKDVFPSKQLDAYCKFDEDNVLISRVRELDSNVNKCVLKEGRLPKNDNEVLIINARSQSINVGDSFDLYLEDDEISDYLSNTKFVIVGKAESSEYMGKFLSTSNINNLDIDIVIYAKNNIFVGEYYTNVAFTTTKGQEYLTTSNEYFDYISNVNDELENFKDIQESYNKNQIIKKANDEIYDAKKELEDSRNDGQKELDDAERDLKKAWNEILDGQKEIDDGIIKLEDAQNQINTNKSTLNSSKAQIADAKAQIVNALSSNPYFIGQSFDEIRGTVNTQLENYNNLIAQKNLIQPAYDNIVLIYPTVADVDIAISNLDVMDVDYDSKLETLNGYKSILENYQYIDNLLVTIYTPENVAMFGNLSAQIEQIKSGENAISSGEQKLRDAQYEVDSGWIDIEDAKNKLAKGKREYYDGLKEYDDGKKEFEEKIADAEKEIADAEKEIQDLDEPKWYILDRDSHYSSYMFKNTCSQMQAIGVTLPIMFFLVAALVCMTTMTRLVDEQRSEIGTYYGLGYPKKYMISKYILYVFIASMLGSIPAILVGMLIFPTVIYTTWRLMYVLPEMIRIMPLNTLLISISSFTILMIIVTYFVMKKSLIENPAQLMRPKSPKSSKGVFLERITFLWNRFSFTMKITARNLIRYKSRFFMTIIGVAGCTGLLVLGWGIRDSISDVINEQYGNIFNYTYTINLEDEYKLDNIINKLKNDSNNKSFAPYMAYTSKVTFSNGKNATINALVLTPDNLNSVFNLDDYRNNNRLSLDNDGVIITEKFAINNNLKIGDIINIESKDGKTKDVKISAIAVLYFQHYMYISEELYSELFGEEIVYTNIAVDNRNDTGNLLSLEKNDGVASITDFASFTEQFNIMIEALDLIIAVVILTAGALAFAVLINLIQVNISERAREIATFKVLGFREKEIETYIFLEIIILTIIGGLIGLPLGKIEEKYVMSIINMDMVMFSNNIKPLSYFYAFSITMIFTSIVLIFAKKPLKKINMIDSLKSVE